MEPLDGFLLAAGLGTRMGPLSEVLPKPAWPLGGRSLLLWSAGSLKAAGFRNLGCNAHHLSAAIREAASGQLTVFDEPELLGSAGGLRHARGRCADPLAVWNGDALAEVPWEAFRASHLRRSAQLSWLLVPHPGGPWNPVWTDAEGWILPAGAKGRGPYHFTGAALWSAEALALLPDQGPVDTKRDVLPCLRRHLGVVMEPFPWLEVGDPDQLIAAAARLAPLAEGRLPGCYVHPTARSNGSFQRCVLGPGAAPPPGLSDANALWFGDQGRQVRLSLP